MKPDLPCYVVRDLLPSYIEGLTEAETTAAVKAHLDACPDCKARYASMVEVAGVEPATPETQEVDYLKAVRRKTRKKIVLAAVLAVVLVLGIVCSRFFLIGWISDGSSLNITPTVSEDGRNLQLEVVNTASATAVLDWNMETYEDDGIIDVDAREVLVSPFREPEETTVLSIPLTGVNHVYVCGRLLWQEGLLIDRSSYAMLGAINPYVGDAPAMGALVSVLNLDASLELQTAREPYGLTLHFTRPVAADHRSQVDGSAYLLLALTGNLGEVHWDDPSGWSGSLTLAEANEQLPELVADYNDAHGTEWTVPSSIQDYAGTLYGVQQLRELLSL